MRSRRRPDLPLRGDEGHLFRQHADWLIRVTKARLKCSEALAEDACGFAWLQLCRRQPERTDRLPGWLRIVAMHEGFRLLRHLNREPLFEDACRQEREDGSGGAIAIEDVATHPVDVELAVEAREALRAVAGLRWRRRRVIELRLAGFSYAEIQERLGVTHTNVNRHVTEGRAELRNLRIAA